MANTSRAQDAAAAIKQAQIGVENADAASWSPTSGERHRTIREMSGSREMMPG